MAHSRTGWPARALFTAGVIAGEDAALMRIVLDARYAGPRVSGMGNYVRAIASRMPRRAPDLSFRYWIRPGTPRLSDAANVTETIVRPRPSGLATLLRPGALDRLSNDDLFHAPSNILGFGLP